MAIKYLRGIYGPKQVRTTRPIEFDFPLGLTVSNPTLSSANSANSSTTKTFDVLVVAGGGSGGGGGSQGGGGAGGVRILSANSFSEVSEIGNPNFISGTTNFIPVIVGSSDTNSCFGSNFITCRGGGGGFGGNGGPGGSGGGGGQVGGPSPVLGGSGIAGQGCPGGTGNPSTGGPGGSATSPGSTTGGVTSSITGTGVRYGDGGSGGPAPPAAANVGKGGPGGLAGGSGIVAIRYRNPVAPTTPIATGGTVICCTGGCIIHVFCSSSFFNVATEFSIN